jgi:O-antigen/teichoic acid export membrane protein
MSLSRSIAWNTLVHAMGKGGAMIVGFLSFALLTHYLGVAGFGHYRTVLNYLSTASIAANLGLYPIVLRELSRDRAPQAYVLGNAMALRLVTSSLFLCVAAALSYLLPYEAVVHHAMLLGIIGFVSLEVTHVLLAVFQQHLQQWQAALAEIIGAGVTLIAVGMVIYWGGSVITAVGTMAIGHLAWAACAWYLAYRLAPFRLSWAGAEWKRLVLAALPLAGVQILNLMYLRVDAVILSLYQPASDVGVYGVASKLLEMAMTLPYMFAGLVMPLLSQHAHQNPATFRRYVSTAFEVLSIAACGIAVGFYVLAPHLVAWIGGVEFREAAAVLQLFSAAIGLYCLSSILIFAVTALGQQRLMMWAYAMAAAASLLTYLLLIPQYSYFGAALGRIIAEAIVVLATARIVVREIGGLPSLAVLYKALAASAMALGVWRLLAALGIPWGVNFILAAGSFVGGLMLLRAFPDAWSKMFNRKAPQR